MLNNLTALSLPSNGKNVFFGAANTGDGFYNGFENILKPYRNRVLIKGGPGTGKSTLMKKFYSLALERCYSPEMILCSSDPDSLDGVLVKTLSLAVVDATAPHTFEPAIPGVTDIIFDPSHFWNENVLAENSEYLIKLSEEKKKSYSLAYEMLAGAKRTRSALYSMTEEACDRGKIEQIARAICKNALPDESHKKDLRFCSSISSKGYVRLDTLETLKGDHTVIRDSLNTSAPLLSEIEKHLDRLGVSYIRFPDPLDPTLTEAIRTPSSGMTITVNSDITGAKVISTRRYTDNGKYALLRSEIRPLIKETESMLNMAFYYLQKAARCHSEIEKVYISAMDFPAMEEASKKLFAELL